MASEKEISGTEPRFIVVIGTSAGGLNALTELVRQFDTSINAAVFVVMHLSHKGISDFLVHRLEQFTDLPCIVGGSGMTIEKGNIYVAPPNFHMIIKDNLVLTGHGPEENRWRPSIDVLFRSAAASYGSRVIGIVLTGLLDDGTAGMAAIKKCGGRCIVQDPNEAEYPDMPMAVLNSVEVDGCVSLAEMGNMIHQMTSVKEGAPTILCEEVKAESEIAEKVAIGIDVVSAIGEATIYSCPHCGGGLWKITNGNVEHYRCHIGHSLSERDLLIKQAEQVESTLWVAMRILEERRNLLKKLEREHKQKGYKRIASDHADRAMEMEMHIDKLKKLLFDTQNSDHT